MDSRNECRICALCLLTPEHGAEGGATAVLERVGLLSHRERDVLLLLSGGPSNRDISQALCISERTAKAHVSSILSKLAVKSRLQACLIACAYHAQNCPKGQ
ncbi:response regulator transcription factor [Streptomyces sp. bgisy100]|uniref:response regulator transcription factor n=1 Tax=Streptomyces sp. bgisy100 TaxID=3413783 RepID=UPI003D74A5C0